MLDSTDLSEITPADTVVGERSRALLAVWDRLKKDRIAPLHEEITPALPPGVTPWIWNTDVIEAGKDFRFRFGGQPVVEFMGEPHSGVLLSEMPDCPFFTRLRTILTHCVRQRKPVAWGQTRESNDHPANEVLVLPLSGDGADITGLIGVMEAWPVTS
jgi:hypothetical protein